MINVIYIDKNDEIKNSFDITNDVKKIQNLTNESFLWSISCRRNKISTIKTKKNVMKIMKSYLLSCIISEAIDAKFSLWSKKKNNDWIKQCWQSEFKSRKNWNKTTSSTYVRKTDSLSTIRINKFRNQMCWWNELTKNSYTTWSTIDVSKRWKQSKTS